MKEVVRFMPLFLAKEQAALLIETLGENEGSTKTILEKYRDTDKEEFFRNFVCLRFSHNDIWHFCVYTEMLPDSFCLGNAVIPHDGMNSENRIRLEDFFFENRKTIVDRIISDIDCGKLKIYCLD